MLAQSAKYYVSEYFVELWSLLEGLYCNLYHEGFRWQEL